VAKKERPIIFSGDMVRAILEGRKTQTRRVMKCWRIWELQQETHILADIEQNVRVRNNQQFIENYCRYGQPGDRLWVRETWASYLKKPSKIEQLVYKSTHKFQGAVTNIKWRPSIHIPRWASRITLEITGIRVERVIDISIQDAIAEGFNDRGKIGEPPMHDDLMSRARGLFRNEWNKIYADKGFGWSVNPWVWVIEFKRIKP
jgi:hypothetical protein